MSRFKPLNGNQGTRLHLESFRVGLTKQPIGKYGFYHHVPANIEHAKEREKFFETCSECTRKALYRYFKVGTGWYGRCKHHKEGVSNESY